MPRFSSPLRMAFIATTITSFCLLASQAMSFSLFPFFTTQAPVGQDNPAPIQNQYQGQAQAFDQNIHQMADILFANLVEPDPEVGDLMDGIAVSCFVDLKKLSRTSSFGRYLAEQLMTEFQHRGYRVVEIRKSTSIILQEKRGEYGLSRNVAEVKSNVAARTMLTGTYTIAGDKIMVNAKVIDNKNANLLSSATMIFSKNPLTNLLLADAASASPRNNSVIYMKKLESYRDIN